MYEKKIRIKLKYKIKTKSKALTIGNNILNVFIVVRFNGE